MMLAKSFAQTCLPGYGRFAKRKSLLVLLFSTVSIFTIFILVQIYAYGSISLFQTKKHRTGFKYSVEVEKYSKTGYLINTPTCRILNITAWDNSILPFLNPEKNSVNCNTERRQWTYTKGSSLIINTTSMGDSGHSLNSVACCYMKITRLEDSREDYDHYSDLRISFTKECIPLTTSETDFSDGDTEFIRVLCQGKYWPIKSEVLYRKFHALPLISKNSDVKNKIRFWRERQVQQQQRRNKTIDKSYNSNVDSNSIEIETPPSFVLLGIDSMSRLSFQRNMPKTRKVMQQIGAIEMLGYTKVGENTFPNAVAFLSGYSEDELQKLCYFSRETRQDDCPYIWKRFSAANYLTAFIEDVPLLGGFNYKKTGFIKPPADYYFRPFMLGVHGHSPAWTYTLDCIGHRTVDETLLQYIDELHQMSLEKNTPLFLYSWLTNMAHEDINVDQQFDNIYANFLRSFDLNNTVFILMSDHGFRFGEIRQTFPGWYEDKLPTFWAYLPPSVVRRFPGWRDSLLVNSKRLTSPFDFYQTMSDFLDTFTKSSKQKWNKYPFSRKRGQSLFTKVPVLRTCQDTGVPDNFCACVPDVHTRYSNTNTNILLSPNDTLSYKAALTALKYLNSILPKSCVPFTLSTVINAAIIENQNPINSQRSQQNLDSEIAHYIIIVSFLAQPGEFRFEANVSFTTTIIKNTQSSQLSKISNLSSPSEDNFRVISDLIRIDRISTDVSCVTRSVWIKYCYCAFLLQPNT